MSNISRRQDHGLGKTAAGGSGGSFAAHEREGATPPPISLSEHISALAAEQSAHARIWNAAEERLLAYKNGRIKSDINWIDDSLSEEGTVRQADWRLAMAHAWRGPDHRMQISALKKYPALRRFLDDGHVSHDLAAECRQYAADSKTQKKQGELSALCERYAKHGGTEHESDQPAAYRADRLNTEAAAGDGLTDAQMLRGKQLADDTLGPATRGELSDNEHDNLLTLADTLEDQNFHAESITYEAIARVHDARRNPDQKITGTAAWVILSAQIDVPDDIRERARRDDPSSARSASTYRQHARAPFL
ncbi:hypothetical protein EDF62_3337 [Leucobacter luti]|uniref:Uncharacterized protein n=1 Tax=Leucobacter luti TaxID=340320 RepID=A0A4R6RS82_9MICO|nr:hypothetical protein [Leucobacter luti]TDP89584.1 hypothetical protein EDF62_3337 [Leucobacter luti]